jgi:hypothetical protein
MGIEDGSPHVLAATDAVLREQLQDHVEALGDLDEVDLMDVIGNAKSLVHKALAALHAVEYRRRILETVAGDAVLEAINVAVAEVVAKDALREEWRRREHWVRKEAYQKYGPKKMRNRHRKTELPQRPDSQILKKTLERVVENVHRRSMQYEFAAAKISALEKQGFLRPPLANAPDEAKVRIARQQLALDAGPKALFDGEVIESVVPKRTHVENKSTIPLRPTITPSAIISVFDAAHARDDDFAAARADEMALKAGIQMSLAENRIPDGNICDNLAKASSSHEQHVTPSLDEDTASQSS